MSFADSSKAPGGRTCLWLAAAAVAALLLHLGAAAVAGARGPGEPPILVRALMNVMEYYGLNYPRMNLDAIFGLRALQGCLLEVMSHLRGHPVQLSTMAAIKALEARAAEIAALADPIIKTNEPEYYHAMSFVLWHPFRPRFRLSTTNDSLLWPRQSFNERQKLTDSALSEDLSDNCMMEIAGVLGGGPCRISKLCARGMMTKGLVDYGLTHQLLYTVMAEQWECSEVVGAKLQDGGLSLSFDAWQQELCTNMLRDMRDVMANKSLVADDEDLFFEQVFICGTLGFEEFMNPEWLPLILSEQDGSGCFKVKKKKRQSERVLKRKLLNEKVLNDGCLAHKTAVAAGALVAYLELSLLSPTAAAALNQSLNDCCTAAAGSARVLCVAAASVFFFSVLTLWYRRRHVRPIGHWPLAVCRSVCHQPQRSDPLLDW